ncbi:ribonuclease H-like domain-containing protein, partial [Cyathus striatus]
GSGIWYTEAHPWNMAFCLPHLLATNNAAELAAILLSLQCNNNTKIIKIISDSQYCINGIVTHLQKWADLRFIAIQNADILHTLYVTLITTPNMLLLKKVKGHSGDKGNEGADRLAVEGASKPIPDTLNLSKGAWAMTLSAKLSCMSQSILYWAIHEHKYTRKQNTAHHNIALAICALEENTGTKPTAAAIWKSVQNGSIITKKAKTFLWKTLQGGHKIGEYWEHTPLQDQYMPCTHCDVKIEKISHILLDCDASRQQHIWELAQATWKSTNLPWPHMSIGLIMGITLANITSTDREVIHPQT